MQKVLVTGGGGFVGKAVVKQLLGRGLAVTVIGRNHYAEVEKMGARVITGDICHSDFLNAACAGHDTVFHVAAKAGVWGSLQEYYAINVQGTENVISACRHNCIKTLVYTSTPSVVFRDRDLEGVDETTPYADTFLCHYAETKVMAEKKVLAANCETLLTTALRPHLIWGPGDTNLIPRLVERGMKQQLKIVGDGRNRVDISYIDNVADAHILAAINLEKSQTAAGQAYFISQGEPVYIWQWINDLFARINIAPVRKRVSFKKAYFAGKLLEKIYLLLRRQDEPPMTRFVAEQLAKSHWFSIDKARSDLGYSPRVSTAEGMEKLVNWLNQSHR